MLPCLTFLPSRLICKPDDLPSQLSFHHNGNIAFTQTAYPTSQMDQPGMLTWVNEDLEALQGSQQKFLPTYRPRAAHTKSRKGCHNCKLRKIKVSQTHVYWLGSESNFIQCDETTPNCGQCRHRGVQCDFVTVSTTSQATSSTPSEQTTECGNSRASAKEWIEAYLDHREIPTVPCSELKSLADNPCNSIELLSHFFDEAGPWIGSPACQRTMQQHCLQLSVEAPYLLHALLAFSANHLSFLHPAERRYRVTAIFHYDISLASYSARIRTRLEADSLLGACYLHTMLAFRNLQSADNAESGNALTWLRTMQGTAILRSHLRPNLNESVWQPVAIESRSLEDAACNHLDSDDSWASSTSLAFHQLCEADVEPMLEENPYEKPLSRLCLLMRCQIGQDKIGMFMSFIGRLPSSFVQLLDQNDTRAMLILCYWCALLGQIDQWWIVGSAAGECLRLCKLLNAIPDQRIRDLLKFPANKCGYVITAQ